MDKLLKNAFDAKMKQNANQEIKFKILLKVKNTYGGVRE